MALVPGNDGSILLCDVCDSLCVEYFGVHIHDQVLSPDRRRAEIVGFRCPSPDSYLLYVRPAGSSCVLTWPNVKSAADFEEQGFTLLTYSLPAGLPCQVPSPGSMAFPLEDLFSRGVILATRPPQGKMSSYPLLGGFQVPLGTSQFLVSSNVVVHHLFFPRHVTLA